MLAPSRLILAGAPVLCALLFASCTAPASDGYGAPAASSAASSAGASGSAAGSNPAYGGAPAASATGADAATLALTMGTTSLGSILTDGRGLTLYLFTKDSPNTSTCTGGCLAAWPPLIGKPTAGTGVTAAKLGSFTRTDGRAQATYNGWPLYYWAGDAKPGDVSGQNVSGVWFVLDASGSAVRG